MASFPAETGGVAKRCAALSVEKPLTEVKKNHKKCAGVEALTKQVIRASSHPPVSVSHQSGESMNST
jgi:hypothetical protein